MPAYNASPALILSVGTRVSLVNNAAVDSGITATQQAKIESVAGVRGGTQFSVFNSTNQPVTIEIAPHDQDVNYLQLQNGDTGNETSNPVVCPAGMALSFTTAGPYIRGLFGTAPTSGSLTITR